MHRTAAALLLFTSTALFAADWPAWRGPTGQGVSEEKNLPLKWSAKENVKWKIPLANPGNSTPVISGGKVTHSVLSPGVHIHSYATITDSVLLDFVQVGRSAKIHRAIIDKNVIVPPGVSIGFDREKDLARGFTVTDSGITVVGKSQVITP